MVPEARQVIVAVDQAGEEGHAGDVQYVGVKWIFNRASRPDLNDTLAIYHHGGIRSYRAAGAIDEGCSD